MRRDQATHSHSFITFITAVKTKSTLYLDHTKGTRLALNLQLAKHPQDPTREAILQKVK